MTKSAGLPTWVERLLIGTALFFAALLVLTVVAVVCDLIGIPLPSLDDGN